MHLQLDQGCARVTMTRGATGNPLTHESAGVLLAALRWTRAVGARVVVLASDGPSWCVGGDLREFGALSDPDERAAYIDDLAEPLHRIVSELMRSDAIVLSVVDGIAAGAGMPLALAADLVVASERARFTLGYTKIGLTPDGGTTLLTATLGLHRTLQLALLNPVLSAAEAHGLGLVTEVVPADGLADAVEQVVAQLVTGPAQALAATKHLIRDQATGDAEAALRRETLSVRRAAATAEAGEGIAAFLEKRPPRFPGAAT